MENPNQGEVWTVDLGMAAKTRPCLVVSRERGADDRDIVTIIPHTTSVTGSRYEVPTNNKSLQGAFNVQGITSVSRARFEKRLMALGPTEYEAVLETLKLWLDL